MTRDPKVAIQRRFASGTLDPAMLRAIADSGDDLAWLHPRPRPSERWWSRFARLERWRAFHPDVDPNTNSDDPEESELAFWVARDRRFPERLDEEQRAALSRVWPGWENQRRRTLSWEQQLEANAAILAARGYFASAAAKDPDEKSAAQWLVKQRFLERAGDLKPERTAQLDDRLPGWRDPMSVRRRTTLQAYVDWTAEHGRVPRTRCDEPVETELGQWRVNLNKNLDADDPFRAEIEAAVSAVLGRMDEAA